MNDFETRRQARIERLRERAESARQESESRNRAADQIASYIPFGQPILVGHHSEKRHRRDLERIDNHMRQAIASSQKAKHYEQAAEAAESNTSISSDDPDAVDKLREKLAELEARQTEMKADNAKLRKAKIAVGSADIDGQMRSAGLSEHSIKELVSLGRICPYHCRPYYRHPTYELSNNNANIKRVRDRITILERRQAEPEREAIEGDGFTISEDKEWGRILIEFNGKPASSVRDYLKSNGWRWAPSRSAWVRHLNGNGRMYATWAAEKLPEIPLICRDCRATDPTPEGQSRLDSLKMGIACQDQGAGKRHITKATKKSS